MHCPEIQCNVLFIGFENQNLLALEKDEEIDVKKGRMEPQYHHQIFKK